MRKYNFVLMTPDYAPIPGTWEDSNNKAYGIAQAKRQMWMRGFSYAILGIYSNKTNQILDLIHIEIDIDKPLEKILYNL